MIRLPPTSTVTAPRSPYTPLFRSGGAGRARRRRAADLRVPAAAAIFHAGVQLGGGTAARGQPPVGQGALRLAHPHRRRPADSFLQPHAPARSEEHTSELQSLMSISHAVF